MDLENERVELTSFDKNWLLFKIYFLTSLFTFTGGLAMISVLKREIVDKHHLMTEKEFYNYAAISQTLPGVIAINNACFVGKRINGLSGMIIAAISAILPAFVFMLIATVLYNLLPKDGPIYFALSAIRAISAAFIFSAALTIAKHHLKSMVHITTAILCGLSIVFGLLGALELIVIAIVIGLITAFSKRKKVVGETHDS